MRNRLRLGLVIVATLMLCACANSDYFEPTALTDSDNAMVYIYRPAATNPGEKPLVTSYPEVTIDGSSVGMLRYNHYLAIELPPGEHEIIATGLTRDARWDPKDRSYKLKTTAGEEYFMRFRVEFNTDSMSIGTFRGQYQIHLHPVDASEAVYEIRHTNASNE